MFGTQKNHLSRMFKPTESSSETEETKLMSEHEEELQVIKPNSSLARTNLILSLISMFVFVSGALMVVSTLNYKQSDRSCAAQLSIWSPLFQAVEYEERDWESIFTRKHSEWTGAPTVELEDRWHRLVNVPTVIIPENRVPALNRSIEQGFVKGGRPGQEGYIAGIEVFHHLHCLNVLRQALWVDDYPEGLIPSLFKYNSPAVARKHADHCISTLHQALTCNADLTPYLLYDSTGNGAGVAREDFQATHKCKRFEPLVDWITENGVVVSQEDLRSTENSTA